MLTLFVISTLTFPKQVRVAFVVTNTYTIHVIFDRVVPMRSEVGDALVRVEIGG